ncbi:MAG: nuclease [Acidilobus sp.]
MVTTIEISGYVEDMLEALVRAGIYSSKTEAIRDAVRRLVESFDMKEVSLKAYRGGTISFQMAVEISGVSIDELIMYFLSRDTAPGLGADAEEDVVSGLNGLREASIVVLDLSSLYAALELNLQGTLVKFGKRFLMPTKVAERAQALILKFSKMRGIIVSMDGIEEVKVDKNFAGFAHKNGITVQEAQAIYVAKKSKGVLLSDDKRTRQVARAHGVPAATTLSLLLLGKELGVIDEQNYRLLVGRLGAIPYQIPKQYLG